MVIIAALVWLAFGSAYAIYFYLRWALARQAAQDAATLATYRLGHSHRSAACVAPYDQSKVAQWQRRENAKAGRARRKSRLAQDRVKPTMAPTPFRKVK